MANKKDVDLTVSKIYQLMGESFTKGEVDGEYWYDYKWKVTKIDGKTLVEAFFIQHENIANEYFDNLFDQLHPF